MNLELITEIATAAGCGLAAGYAADRVITTGLEVTRLLKKDNIIHSITHNRLKRDATAVAAGYPLIAGALTLDSHVASGDWNHALLGLAAIPVSFAALRVGAWYSQLKRSGKLTEEQEESLIENYNCALEEIAQGNDYKKNVSEIVARGIELSSKRRRAPIARAIELINNLSLVRDRHQFFAVLISNENEYVPTPLFYKNPELENGYAICPGPDQITIYDMKIHTKKGQIKPAVTQNQGVDSQGTKEDTLRAILNLEPRPIILFGLHRVRPYLDDAELREAEDWLVKNYADIHYPKLEKQPDGWYKECSR